MSRKARIKSSEAIYHITSRSISEALLFREESDKDYYLKLLKKYADKYSCSIYAYCLMDNHIHIHLDPKGFDISKFMLCLNTAYARYYNIKYDRHGPIFQGRFHSAILDTDRYNLAVSAYIHKNASDIKGFRDREEYYNYSSYGIYLGIKKDKYNLIDLSFIMKLFDINDREAFSKEYYAFVKGQRNVEINDEIKNKVSLKTEYEYVSGRKIIAREYQPSKVISFIEKKLKLEGRHFLAVPGKRSLINFRSFCAYALRVLSGLSYKEICDIMYNITISGCAQLCDKGHELISSKKSIYYNLYRELLNDCAA